MDVFGRVHGAYTAPYTGCVHGHVWAVHTAVYTTRIRPRTRVYVYKDRVHGRVRAIYTAKNGRLHGRVTCHVYGRVRAVSARVHGSLRAVCTAVFGHIHWPCTLPFSAVYIARTRPCNGPCTRPLHGRVQGPSGPCKRQVGLPGRVHFPDGTFPGGPLRHTVCLRDRVHGRVTCYVPVTRRPCTRPVNTSSPGKTARTRPYNGRAVYTTRTRPCRGRAHGPSTPPVYMTVYGPPVRTTDVFGRVHGEYTAPHTGRVHGHVRAVHTAVYTTRIRPRTRVYVNKGRVHRRVRAIYTAENGRLHGRKRPCNVSCIRPCRVYGRVWAVPPRVHGSVRAV